MTPSRWQTSSATSMAWWWATGAVALAAIGVALWLQLHRPADNPAPGAPAGTPAQAPAWPLTSPASAVAAPPAAVAQRGASAPGVALPAAAASKPSLPPVEAPAESLRKVQLALGGGTPEEALAAGQTLQFCAQAAKAADAMHQARDLAPLVPPPLQKALEALGGVTNEQMARADQEQRRCQVFDAATLARAGELLRRAHDGGAPGAVMPYLLWLQGDGRADARTDLVAAVQAQARAAIEAGDVLALAPAAFGPAANLGATPAQAKAYREAWLRISDELNPGSAVATKTLLDAIDQLGHAQALTAEQQREADALALKIVQAWQARMQRGG